MRKLVPILLALIVVMTSTVVADELPQTTRMYVICKPDDYVNVREHPSTKSAVAGYLWCGDYVETDGTTKRDKQGREWTKLIYPRYENTDTWVCSMYLQMTAVTVETCGAHVVSRGRTALRRSPGGKRIKWAKNGDELFILAMSDEWALTTRGYIRREFIDIFYF